MNPLNLTLKEIKHRWQSSLLTTLLIALITGTIAFFVVNSKGFEKEIGRNVRDIGSNIVILPSETDQFAYHQQGGFNSNTMPYTVVDQLIEFRASLNHLIPMLERMATCEVEDAEVEARIVGLSSSIPVPGRPKAPMQKSIAKDKVQIGATLATKLKISRDAEASYVSIHGRDFPIDRVNRENGTWQDSAVFMDLKSAQALFDAPGQVSRIEAIECTQEKCESTGLQSNVILANELAQITDAAVLLRRDQMASARLNVRQLSQQNLQLLKNLLWVFLAVSMIALATLNSTQRQSEIGVLQSIGFGQTKVAMLFVCRSIVLCVSGCLIGIGAGSFLAFWQSRQLFEFTGKKFAIDWTAGLTVGLIAVLLSILATAIPAIWSASQHPADLIGKEV